MLRLFQNRLPSISQGVITNVELVWLIEYYKRVAEQITKYRENKIWYVKNDHILNRILQLGLDPFGLDDIEYFKMIDSHSKIIIKNLQLSSTYNQGIFHKGNIWKDTLEVYFVKEQPITLINLKDKLIHMDPVKVIYTNCDNIDLTVPDSNIVKDYKLVLEIDLFAYFFKYKYWYEEQLKNNKDTSTVTFIGSIIAPGILNSFLDMCNWNIVRRLIEDKSFIPKFINGMPFSISDYSNKLIKRYSEYVERFRGTKNSYEKVLENIPMVNSKNALDLLTLDMNFTRVSYWVGLYTRLDSIISVIEWLGKNGTIANAEYIAPLKRAIRQIINMGDILPNNTPEYIKKELLYKLYRIHYLIDR